MNENLSLIVFIAWAIAFIIRYIILIYGIKDIKARKKIHSQKLYYESIVDKIKNDFERDHRETTEFLNKELAMFILFIIPVRFAKSRRKHIFANICLFILYTGMVYGIFNMIISKK